MASTTRAGKGSALTHAELDANFIGLDGKLDPGTDLKLFDTALADWRAYIRGSLTPSIAGADVSSVADNNGGGGARSLGPFGGTRTLPSVILDADGRAGLVFDGVEDALLSVAVAEAIANGGNAHTITMALDAPAALTQARSGDVNRNIWSMQWHSEGDDFHAPARLFVNPAGGLCYGVTRTDSAPGEGVATGLTLAIGRNVVQCRYDFGQAAATRTQYRIGKGAWNSAATPLTSQAFEWHKFAIGNPASPAQGRGAAFTLRHVIPHGTRLSNADADEVMDEMLALPTGRIFPVGAAYLRLMGQASTPENNGIVLDRNAAGDCTAGLNKWYAKCATNGDKGEQPGGNYRVTGPLLVPPGLVNVEGVGDWTRIIAATDDFDIVRVKGRFDLNNKVRFGRIGISGPPGPRTRNFKSAFVLDNAPQAQLDSILVENMHIGGICINNSYNTTLRRFMTNRRGTNVIWGFVVPQLEASGADWIFYDFQVAGTQIGLAMGGDTGGFHFHKMSIGREGPLSDADIYSDPSYAATNGRRMAAPIVLGLDVMVREARGIGTLEFTGGHVEGWEYTPAIVSFAPIDMNVSNVGFNPSAPTERMALAIYHGYGFRNARQTWNFNNISGGRLANADIMELTDVQGSGGIHENSWGRGINNITIGGVAQNDGWLTTLLNRSNYRDSVQPIGHGTFRLGNQPIRYEGRAWSYVDPANGNLRTSIDKGQTWKTVAAA